MFKDLVVYLEEGNGGCNRLEYAVRLAQRWNALLIATFVSRRLECCQGGEFARGQAVLDVLQKHRRKTAEAETKIRELCDRLTRARQVAYEWRCSCNEVGEALMLHARFASLAVVGPPFRPEDPVTPLSLSESVILESGRPTLMLPSGWPADRLPRRIVIGWNGSREAARIIAFAMPFLVAAAAVHLVVVPDEKVRHLMGEDPGMDISKHLARYGVAVELEQLSGGNAGKLLLDRCKALDADLLVIGAHSSKPGKLSEIIFGTVTKTVLGNVECPMLL